MSYFTLSGSLGNPAEAQGAPRKPKASFADFLNQSGGQEEITNSFQSSPEKKNENENSKEDSPVKQESSYDSYSKSKNVEGDEKNSIEKRESIQKTEKRESVKTDVPANKRDSAVTKDKRESIKTDVTNNKRDSAAGTNQDKRESIKTDKRESTDIKQIDTKTNKRESIKTDQIPQKRESLKKSNPPQTINEKPMEENNKEQTLKQEKVSENEVKPRPSLLKTREDIKQPTALDEGCDEDHLAHPPVPKSPMHRSGIPLLNHSYTIVEHKVDFPSKQELSYVPKYSDDSEVGSNKEKVEDKSNESWNPVRKKSFQKSKTLEMDEKKEKPIKKKNSKFKDLSLSGVDSDDHDNKVKEAEESQEKSQQDISLLEDDNDKKQVEPNKNETSTSPFNSADYPQIDQKLEDPEKNEENENQNDQEENSEAHEKNDIEEEHSASFKPKKRSNFAPKENEDDNLKKSQKTEDKSEQEVPTKDIKNKSKKEADTEDKDKNSRNSKANEDEEKINEGNKKKYSTKSRKTAEKTENFGNNKKEDEDDEDEDDDDDEDDDEEEIQRKEKFELDKKNKENQLVENGDDAKDEEVEGEINNQNENHESDENIHNDEEEDDEEEERNEEDEQDVPNSQTKPKHQNLKNPKKEQDDDENSEEEHYEKDEGNDEEEVSEKGYEEEKNENYDEENNSNHDDEDLKRKQSKKSVGMNSENYLLDEGAKERKKKYLESLTQNYLDKINRGDNDLNKNNISYKIINEMLNGQGSGELSEKHNFDETALKKQLYNLQQVIDSKQENYNIISSDYQNFMNSYNLNLNNEKTLKSQLDDYSKMLEQIETSLKELTCETENSKSKPALLEELRVKREEEVKLNEEYKYLIDRTRLLNDTKKKKEKDIARDFAPKIQELEKKLESLRHTKLTIHNNLNSESEFISQLFESKALLKEDLNGKLLQRAELVAQREELDQIFEDFQEKYQKDINFFSEENDMKNQLTGFQKKLTDVSNNKKIYQINIDNIVKNINGLTEKLQLFNQNLSFSSQEKNETLNKIISEKEKAEEILSENFKQFDFFDLDKLLENLSKNFSQILDKIILINQMKFVEEEEEKMNINYQIKCHNLEGKYNEISDKKDLKINELQIQAENMRQQHEHRRDAIVKWKEEVNNLLKGEKPSAEKLLELIDKDKNMVRLEKSMKDKNLEIPTQNNLKKIFKYYLEILLNYQTYYINKENQESEMRNEILKLEEEVDKINEEKMRYEEKYMELEDLYTKYIYSIKSLEQSLNEKKTIFEHNLILQAENAYHEYLTQQSQTFEAINRTYGAKAAQHIKQEYYKQFLDIIKGNQQKRLEKFNSIKDDLKYLDDVIQYNISNVDNEILPQLKGCVNKISEVKQHLSHIKREQIKALENEEVLMKELNELNSEKKKKIESMAQNLSNNSEGQDNQSVIEDKKKEIEELAVETKTLENIILEKDEEITELNQERAKITKEIVKIQEKLDVQGKKNKKINSTAENYKETPIFLTDLKTSIFNLEQEKTRLESQMQNNSYERELFPEEDKQENLSFSKGKQQSPQKSDKNHPNLFTDEYDFQEMNAQHYQSVMDNPSNKQSNNNNDKKALTLMPGKATHIRAKSAPKNVNPQGAYREYGGIHNSEELFEELNYIANLSGNQRFNDSNNSPNGKAYPKYNQENDYYHSKSLQQNFEDNLNYAPININNYSNEYIEDDKNSSNNNSYENSQNIFDLNQIPLNNSNSKNIPIQQQLIKSQNNNNRSLSNENKKQINVSIQSLMQEASGNQINITQTGNNVAHGSLILIKKCKFSSLHQDCNRHKKYYKFNLDYCSLKEIQFFESVKPLLDGSTILKKFTTFQSLKQPVFNPLTADQCPPENCGYGTRFINLNRQLNRIEFRHHLKNSVENYITIEQILRPVIPQITKEILRLQKQFDVNNLNNAFKGSVINDALGNSSLVHLNKNLEKMINCSYYSFCLILEKGGRVELIAPNYYIFREWVTGINDLIKMKKFLPKMKTKIETYCMLRTENNKNFL